MSGTTRVYCCPSGQNIVNGVCSSVPACGSGLQCSASAIPGSSACMSGTTRVNCCPSGQIIQNGACTYPVCFGGSSLQATFTATPAQASCDPVCSGTDYRGLAVVAGAGETICNQSGTYSLCTAGGTWTAAGGSQRCVAASAGHLKFGINTARPYTDAPQPSMARTAELGFGYYLEIDADLGAGYRYIPAMNNAIALGLTPILRAGIEHELPGYSQASDYADHLRGMAGGIHGPFYVIAGANEPNREYWPLPSDNRTDPSAEDIATYNQAIIDALLPLRSEFSNLRLLSPVFDCANAKTPEIIENLCANGGNLDRLDGIAINAYNQGGSTTTQYLARCEQMFVASGCTGASAFRYFLTEIGMLEIMPDFGNVPRPEAFRNLRSEYASLNGNPEVRAALFFDALWDNPDPNYVYNRVDSDAEWDYLKGGGGVGAPQAGCCANARSRAQPGEDPNLCYNLPGTEFCPMSYAGGYCDPNGDRQYTDAAWQTGWYEFQRHCQ